MLPIECVVRGYLAGSGWKDYQATGRRLRPRAPRGAASSPTGCRQPIFTPATKAQTGHDENIDRDQAAELVGDERLREVEQVALALYRTAADYALERGIIIADTKFEFGLDAGRDASCSATRRSRPTRRASGPPTRTSRAARSRRYDKQFVRDYCETIGWDKTYPGPGAARGRRHAHARAVRRGVRADSRGSRSTRTSPTRATVLA